VTKNECSTTVYLPWLYNHNVQCVCRWWSSEDYKVIDRTWSKSKHTRTVSAHAAVSCCLCRSPWSWLVSYCVPHRCTIHWHCSVFVLQHSLFFACNTLFINATVWQAQHRMRLIIYRYWESLCFCNMYLLLNCCDIFNNETCYWSLIFKSCVFWCCLFVVQFGLLLSVLSLSVACFPPSEVWTLFL